MISFLVLSDVVILKTVGKKKCLERKRREGKEESRENYVLHFLQTFYWERFEMLPNSSLKIVFD